MLSCSTFRIRGLRRRYSFFTFDLFSMSFWMRSFSFHLSTSFKFDISIGSGVGSGVSSSSMCLNSKSMSSSSSRPARLVGSLMTSPSWVVAPPSEGCFPSGDCSSAS